MPIRTNAREAGETTEYALRANRHACLAPAVGSVEINGVGLNARDGAAVKDEAILPVTALEDAEIVLVDAAG